MKRIKLRSDRVITLSLLLGLSLVGLSLMLARPPVVKAAPPLTVTSSADSGGTIPFGEFIAGDQRRNREGCGERKNFTGRLFIGTRKLPVFVTVAL